MVGDRDGPSDSRFERGRGRVVVEDKPPKNASQGGVGGGWGQETALPTRVSSEGGGGEVVEDKTTPSGSRFEQKRGGVVEKQPRLAYRAREGVVRCWRTRPPKNATQGGVRGGWGRQTAPPTSVSTEGGVGWWLGYG